MVAISSVIGALTVLPEIVRGAETVFGLLGGGGDGPSTAVSNVVSPGLSTQLRGGGIAPAQASAGTSIGPLIDVGITALPPIIAAVQRARAPSGSGIGAIVGGARPPSGGNGVTTMTRKQFILATARAANPGATAKKILRSARECGIELAAATFGLSALDVCFLIAQPPTRRSRGISAADLRRTRSTVR